MTTPEADRPHYSDGTAVPDVVDSSTKQWSRGVDPTTGAKGAEPAEPVPTVSALSPTGGPAAGGTAVTVTGTELGGSTGVTVGGVAATSVVVVSETTLTLVTPAGTVGAQAVVVQNPAGASTGGPTFTYA